MITILDYDSGNIKSLSNALKFLNINHRITRNKKEILDSEKLIIPGVGSFNTCMKNIKKFKLLEVLKIFGIKKKKPILGICLGMQIMMSYGFEKKKTKGLNFIEGECRSLNKKLKLPHVGWKKIRLKEGKKTSQNYNVYFCHSFICKLKQNNFSTSKINYGKDSFISSFKKNNFYGYQFHPEKSREDGLLILKNFCND